MIGLRFPAEIVAVGAKRAGGQIGAVVEIDLGRGVKGVADINGGRNVAAGKRDGIVAGDGRIGPKILLVAAGNGESGDDLYDKALAVVARDRKASTSYIQRRLGIGYNRAASLIERMEQDGVISSPNHKGFREVLLPDHER